MKVVFKMPGFHIWWQEATTFRILVTLTGIVSCYVIVSDLCKISDPKYQSFYAGGKESQPINESRSSRRQILLVTYGRSGSSFTSALISRHPDVFYVFEPLYVLNQEQTRITEGDSVAVIKEFLTCSFSDEYIYSLDNFHFTRSKSTSDFYSCIKTKSLGVPHVTCFVKFLNSCQAHKVAFIKTIRFRVKWVETFLANDPNFKLLYLVRDPRATLFSQARVFRNFDWKTQISNISREHCSVLEADLKEAERLHRLFPGRVLGIRYEDGALDTRSYTEDIYKFLRLKYSEDIAEYVVNITNAITDPETRDYAYSVVRKNSSKAMNRWRFDAGYRMVLEVDKACGHLYSKLGYKYVNSQSDLESSIPLIGRPDPGGIFW